MIQKIHQASEYLRERGVGEPEVGIILGSGLGNYANEIEDAICIPYGEIPGFAVSTAPGHKGALYIGTRQGKRVIAMAGRFHYYEGYSMDQVIFPIRVMADLGVRRVIITNASGVINENFPPGSLMLLSDHINMSGTNPLIGPNVEDLGVRFPDMTETYSAELREKVKAAAKAEGIELCEGVYVMMSGPSFETPAEIRFLRAIGGDAVGMSSVPEAIAARHAGLEIITISCLANAAAGMGNGPLTGEEVLEASLQIASSFQKVVDIAVTV